MNKILLAISTLLLITIYIYYPIFNDKNISYYLIVIVTGLMIFSFLKIKFPAEREDYEDVERQLDLEYTNNGIFSYAENGFSFLKNGENVSINYEDILEMYSFRIQILHSEFQSGYKIITTDNTYEFSQEHTDGYLKLTHILVENLKYTSQENNSPILCNNGDRYLLLYKKY